MRLALVSLGLVAACSSPTDTQRPAKPGFSDCDGDAKNGAETDTKTNAEHCGECGRTCGATNGKPGCVDGECQPLCDAGFAACSSPKDGCTVAMRTSRLHCGSCDALCKTAYCSDGRCVEQRQVTAEVKSGSLLGFAIGDALYVHQDLSLPQSSATFTRVPTAGGEAKSTTVAGMYPWVTDGKSWYGCKAPVGALGSDCRVAKAPVKGGPIEELALVKGAHMNVFAVDDSTVYLGVEIAGNRGAIMAVPIAGGEPRQLVETTTRTASLSATGGSVYFSATSPDAGIYALEKGSQKPVKLAPALSFEVTVHGDYVYYADYDGVQRVPRKGGAVEWLAATGAQGRSVDGIAIAGETLYFGVTGDNQPMELRAVPIPKLAPTP